MNEQFENFKHGTILLLDLILGILLLLYSSSNSHRTGMRKFKSMSQAHRFLGAHAAVYNLFNLSRHLVSAENYR